MNRQELFENFDQVKIGLDEPFHFKCRSCGKCCKNREDILLTPRDLFRIALHLEKTPGEVVREYCECYIGADSRFPIVRLRPRGANNACPLLENKRCRVHTSKPFVCALFPLGRVRIAEKHSAESGQSKFTTAYILNPVDCGSAKKTYTVRRWLEKFNIPIEDAFHIEWTEVLTYTSSILQKVEDTVTDKTFLALQNMLIELLYIRYNPAKDFFLQFTKNSKRIKELADNLSGGR